MVAREGLLRFGNPTSTTREWAARWLEHLALVLRNLDDDAWRNAEARAANEWRRRAPGAALPGHGLSGLNTVEEVAAFARVSPSTVARAIKRGELEAVRAGARNVRVTDEAVLHWLGAR
jgi:excisionase family DNA binding protein